MSVLIQPWSKIRKNLEQEMLCDSLRGRVQYFMTRYHGAPDHYGRFSIRVDGKEVFHANPYNEAYVNSCTAKLREERGVPRRVWTARGDFLYDEENTAIENEAVARMTLENHVDMYQVYRAIEEYMKLNIQKALYSDDPMVRLFAVLDRRVGKRTLVKLREELAALPEWLAFFYKLRMGAEGIAKVFAEDIS